MLNLRLNVTNLEKSLSLFYRITLKTLIINH